MPSSSRSHASRDDIARVKAHCQDLAAAAAQKQISHPAYLAELIEGEARRRESHAIERRINPPLPRPRDRYGWYKLAGERDPI